MTITFITNYINHHQVPVADEFYRILGKDYTFIATIPVSEFRKKFGYPDLSDKPYLLKAYESKENYDKAMELAEKSDVVIMGAISSDFLLKRNQLNKQNKLTFIYAERLFKSGYYHLLSPVTWKALFKNHFRYRNKNVYMLCASAYTAYDVSLIGAYPDKCFKWGYFTRVDNLDTADILNQRNDEKIQILWVARLIKLKHPELVVHLAKRLKDNGYKFQIKMAGSGECQQKTEYLIHKLGVEDCVSLIGNMPNAEILSLLRQSHIFIFTSDRSEGWGAVLNEAMSNGCACVASDMIGAAPYLIKHGENGFLFKSCDLKSLTQRVSELIDNKPLREKLSVNAYITMRDIWSPENATRKFYMLAENLLNGKMVKIETGPCSKAVACRKYSY